MDTVSGTIIGAAASLAAGAYLNAKLSIGTDVKTLQHEKDWGKRLGQRIQALGDTCTLYRMVEGINPNNAALWFEGREWSYGELKKGESG
jgi:hypothetical protein